jgi:hypothetical protein
LNARGFGCRSGVVTQRTTLGVGRSGECEQRNGERARRLVEETGNQKLEIRKSKIE